MKRAIIMIVISVMMITSLTPYALASHEEQYIDPEPIEPMYEVTNYITARLSISASGRADCLATAQIPSGYKVDLLAELQQLKGSKWTSIHD